MDDIESDLLSKVSDARDTLKDLLSDGVGESKERIERIKNVLGELMSMKVTKCILKDTGMLVCLCLGFVAITSKIIVLFIMSGIPKIIGKLGKHPNEEVAALSIQGGFLYYFTLLFLRADVSLTQYDNS